MTCKCRFCDSDISAAAIVCPVCRRDLVPGQSTQQQRPQLPFPPVAGETPTSGVLYFLVALVIVFVSLALGPFGPALLVIVTAVWVAFDASTHKLAQYEQSLGSPTTACLGALVLWIVVFPWYLAVRSRIRAGVQPVKVMQS